MGVDQIVTNFKNTRENKPDGREFCAEGIHNVKIWWKYFTVYEPIQGNNTQTRILETLWSNGLLDFNPMLPLFGGCGLAITAVANTIIIYTRARARLGAIKPLSDCQKAKLNGK